MQETVAYFASGGRQPLTFEDRLEFVNFWYLLIIFNDFLTITGCFVKILIENKVLLHLLVRIFQIGLKNVVTFIQV